MQGKGRMGALDVGRRVVNGVTKAPTREKIARWCIAAMDALPTQIVKNSWRHGDYSWFPNETIVNV